MLPHDPGFVALKENLLTMGGLAERAVQLAVLALVEREDDPARDVIVNDEQLDTLEKTIDDLAIHILSKAPLATDLRTVTVAMKISGNLERVGDEATTIARRAHELNRLPQLEPRIDIPGLASLATRMLKDALDAFVRGNSLLAREVIPRDKEVDGINKQFHRELTEYLIQHPDCVARCLDLMVVSKCLERIADHAKNIAEQAVFLLEAQDIRHGSPSPRPTR